VFSDRIHITKKDKDLQMTKKYIFSTTNNDIYGYSYQAFLNNGLITSTVVLADINPAQVSKINVFNLEGSGDISNTDLLIIDKELETEFFYIDYYNGGDEYDDRKKSMNVSFDKNCSKKTIFKVMEILLNSDKEDTTFNFTVENIDYYVDKKEASSILLENNFSNDLIEKILN